MKKIKIDCIADLHLYFGPKLDGGDILVIAGDISFIGREIDFIKFNNWLEKYKNKYKAIVFTPGNHDFLAEFNTALTRNFLTNVTHYLQDDGANILGLKFWGSPQTPAFMNWAFMKERGETLKRYWDMIDPKTDVLVTHGMPFGILDEILDPTDFSKKIHIGDEELLKVICQIKPKLYIGGHIHEGHGRMNKNGIIFVNAAIMNENYNPTNSPITIYL